VPSYAAHTVKAVVILPVVCLAVAQPAIAFVTKAKSELQ